MVRSSASQASWVSAPRSLRRWVIQAEVDRGTKAGLSTEERARMKELERENRELRRAKEILKSAAAFFGAELDRHSDEMTRVHRHPAARPVRGRADLPGPCRSPRRPTTRPRSGRRRPGSRTNRTMADVIEPGPPGQLWGVRHPQGLEGAGEPRHQGRARPGRPDHARGSTSRA